MNKRIFELMCEANIGDIQSYYPLPISNLAIQKNFEAFAKLLIKECAYLVNEQQRTTGYTTHAKMLCDKFGIEYKDEDYYGREK